MGEAERNSGPVVVKNRDIPKLTRMLYAVQDVSAAEQKRMWQQDRLWNMTQRITGMPGGGGTVKGLEEDLAAIEEIEGKYETERKGYIEELLEAEEILNGIPYPKMRTFVTMKYMLGMNRKDIMERLNMKKWAYADCCARIEQAEDMKHVNWDEKYVVKD
ncbi:MAG: hypothetical protein IJ188_06470 [Clostridia bacterium]|nr:hypothetical protein [Clostridia bacterium]